MQDLDMEIPENRERLLSCVLLPESEVACEQEAVVYGAMADSQATNRRCEALNGV